MRSSASLAERIGSASPPAVTARALALRAGGLAILRVANRGGARIVAYHRFPASCAENLRSQCRYLRKFHHVVSLRDIDRWLGEGAPLPPRAVAVSIDDGYRDIYRVAYPVLRDYGIPATVFVTTAFVDGSCWLWCDAVAYLFRHTTVREAEIRVGATTFRLSLDSEPQRAAGGYAVKEAAKQIDDQSRSTLVYQELPAVLRVSLPDRPPLEYEPLKWEEAREMYANGIRFGAHTQTHPILGSINSEDRLLSEIQGCKRRLEEELDHPVAHFAYPNGTFADVSAEAVRQVRKAGYASAFLAEPGANSKSADPFMLRRNTAEPVTPLPFFGRTILR